MNNQRADEIMREHESKSKGCSRIHVENNGFVLLDSRVMSTTLAFEELATCDIQEKNDRET